MNHYLHTVFFCHMCYHHSKATIEAILQLSVDDIKHHTVQLKNLFLDKVVHFRIGVVEFVTFCVAREFWPSRFS